MAELDFFKYPTQPEQNSNPQDEQLAAIEAEMQDTVKKLEKQQAEKEKLDKLIDPLTVDSDTDEDDADYKKHADSLAVFVRGCFEASEKSRKSIEDGWIKALKQYKGIYQEDVAARIAPNRSQAYVRITRTKVKTVDSRLCDLLFPANGDKNWGIIPTPIPDYSPQKKQMLIQMHAQETGEEVTPEKFDVLLAETAKKQSDKMSKRIEDQLSEMKYREIMREVIHSGGVYGTGFLKGPFVSIVENKQYTKQPSDDGTGKWLLENYDRIIPFAENVRVWDIYPDMEATTIDDCRYIIQRRKMNKHDLVCLAKRKDFSSDVINSYVKMYPEGKYEKKSFEVDLQTIGDITSLPADSEGATRKYEVLEFWGYVDTKSLEEFGVEVPEEKAGLIDIPANIWVLGDKVIKAVLSPLEGVKWPFFAYYYDKDETCVFGEGIPSIMSTMQEMTNSAFRAMLDNAAISAGPQMEVNLDLLSEDEDPREVHPFKVWMRTGTGNDAQAQCLRMLDVPSYTAEFERMLNLFSTYSDEITTIPRYMWGDTSGGAGRTSSGLSMLMGSANMAIKDQVKNFDDGITTPFIRAMYHWNMQFGEDEDVKGDYTVIARGSASLIAKEMYAQYLIQFLNITANPEDASIVKRPDIIRAVADTFDLNSDAFVLSDKEIDARNQQQQAEKQQQEQFMTSIVEAARENGISPESLITNMRQLQQEQQKTLQQQVSMLQQQKQQRAPQAQGVM